MKSRILYKYYGASYSEYSLYTLKITYCMKAKIVGLAKDLGFTALVDDRIVPVRINRKKEIIYE